MSAHLAVCEQALAGFVLHALWQVPLLAGAAWCAVKVGRPHIRVAHALWVGTLLLCVVLPLCSTIAARRAAWLAERDSITSGVTFEPVAYGGTLPALQRESAWKRLLHRHVNGRDGLQPFAFTAPPRLARALAWSQLLVMALFALQIIFSWWRTLALVRGASLDPLPAAIQNALEQHCLRLNMKPPRLRASSDIAGPALAGVLRPTLLLPAPVAAGIESAEIHAILLHELAHLRRHDPVLHVLCSVLLLPLAFHPAAWWISQRVRQTREMACDAEAADRMGSNSTYARALLRVAERMGFRQTQIPALRFFSNGLFGAGLELFNQSGAMEERMQMIMKSCQPEARSRRAVRVAACISLGAVAVLSAGMLQVRPALAGERIAPQSAPTTQPVSSSTAQRTAMDTGPRLLGGDHAREQLRQARRDLLTAEREAVSDDDRRRIVTAREVAAAAEQALASVDGSRHSTSVDLSKSSVPLGNLKMPEMAAMQAQMEQQREAFKKMRVEMNSPEWKARMEQQQQTMEKLKAQINSPEFRAKIEAASKINDAQLNATIRNAEQQQARAMEQIRPDAIQRQIDQATQLVARNEILPVPTSVAAADPIKVPSAVMAGNALSKKVPVYPPDAKEKKIQGEVLLHAIISEEGKVEQLNVISSPDEQLSKSAIEAVREWVYKPYLLNGDPKAVDTTITVHYSFSK